MDQVSEWLKKSRDWLDARGKPAWIAAMILGFIFFWPIGLAILIYAIGSKRMMSCKKHRKGHYGRFRPTGNHAFDTYRDETLKRLEEEQGAFESFLDRLRQAKDKAEFDQFMNEQRSGLVPGGPAAPQGNPA